jgi:purine-binding chemotaxis protein CheW
MNNPGTSDHLAPMTEDRNSAESPAGDTAIVTIAKSLEEKKKIFKERARKLAQRQSTEDSQEETLELIEFMLAHERYAIEVAYVKEVYPLKDMTPVPCTPPFVLGIISVRGQVISVVDVKDFFDLPKKEITDTFRVIIVKNNDMEFGILADAVIGERKLPVAKIQSDMPSLKGVRSQYVKGVTQDRLIIMDVDKLLSDESIIVHEEVSN